MNLEDGLIGLKMVPEGKKVRVNTDCGLVLKYRAPRPYIDVLDGNDKFICVLDTEMELEHKVDMIRHFQSKG